MKKVDGASLNCKLRDLILVQSYATKESVRTKNDSILRLLMMGSFVAIASIFLGFRFVEDDYTIL